MIKVDPEQLKADRIVLRAHSYTLDPDSALIPAYQRIENLLSAIGVDLAIGGEAIVEKGGESEQKSN